MKIVFVGLHNKPHKTPLCSSTKSGKLIDRIIKELEFLNVEVVKSNLFDVDYYPTNEDEQFELAQDYWYRMNVEEESIIVLLGAATQRHFYRWPRYVYIEIAHPASKRSHKEMNEYVYKTSQILKNKSNGSFTRTELLSILR